MQYWISFQEYGYAFLLGACSDSPSLCLPSGKIVNLVAEDYCQYLVDYVTCEQRPQRLNSVEESTRAVAGVGRFHVSDEVWGARTEAAPPSEVAQEMDSLASGSDRESGEPRISNHKASHKYEVIEDTTTCAKKRRRHRKARTNV